MRNIQYHKREITVEEFVKIEICKNAGTQSMAYKDHLIGLCEELEISFDNKMRKDEFFDLLIENGYTHENFAERFGVGVSSQVYQKSFGISHDEVKRLEKHGVLKVVGEYRFRAYGKEHYAPLYDVYQYARMSDEELQRLLEKYPKGKRVQKRRKSNV